VARLLQSERQAFSQGETRMDSKLTKEMILEIQIEELEAKVAPDGGETVLPLPKLHGHKY
jgi:hypothetical protein